MDASCLLELIFLHSYIVQDSCPGNGAAHSGPSLPTSINNQGNLPQTCLQDNQINLSFSSQGDSRLDLNDKVISSVLSFGFLFPCLDDIGQIKIKAQ